MNYFIELQGTCWLIQYLNYLGIKYDKNIFYKYLAINRYIRYSKAINLVKEKKIISNKPYLIETLLTFEGSLFDIEDILNYDVIGDLKSDIKIDEIFNYNEKVLMLLLKMFDSGVDLSNEIMNCLQDTFGMISFDRKSDNKNLTILTSDKNFDYKKINFRNSDDLYLTKKCLYNLKNISSIIDYELINGNKVLVSIDIGKSVIDFNKLVYPFEISEKILKEFISINNHYYIIEEKVTEGEKKYYKAFSGFEDNKYFLIDELYLKAFLNCVLYDRIVIDGEIDVDIYKYLEE